MKTNDAEQLNNAVEGLRLIDQNESLSVITLRALLNKKIIQTSLALNYHEIIVL